MPGAVPVLRAYGPGGPHHVLRECADLFREKYGVTVAVSRRSPGELNRKIREDGDLYFGGAEYMLEDFARGNPGVLDLESVEKLIRGASASWSARAIPSTSRVVDCLQRERLALLEVELENMDAPAGSASRRREQCPAASVHRPGRHRRLALLPGS